MKWKRSERCNLRAADPTVLVRWERKIGHLKIELEEFQGSITSRLWYKGTQLLFSSAYHHRHINKLVVKQFDCLENKYQEDLWNYDEQRNPPFNEYYQEMFENWIK